MFEFLSQYPIISALIALGTLAAIFGAVLGFAAVKFKVEGDPLVEQIDNLLPQTQCGQCGFPGCRPYAQAIADGDAINKCPPGGHTTIIAIANLLDVPAPDLDEEHGEESQHRVQRERIMKEMQHDEKLARRVRAAEGRERPRANPESGRDEVKPRALHPNHVENNQSSTEPSGDKYRDQSGFVEMQMEGHAVQASAQGVMRLADAVLQRDSDILARSSSDPTPAAWTRAAL